MQARATHLFVILGCFLIAAPSRAQEGHPLVGSWHGDKGAARRTELKLH